MRNPVRNGPPRRCSRFRVSRAVAKTRYGRFVSVPPVLFEAVLELCPRDDRSPQRRVFQGVAADRLRTAISRACVASGVPWARIGEHVGQRDLAVTANTYSHVLADEAELDYAEMLNG